MKIYLVGGAVRDKLLNLPINDKDYVVVGATIPEFMEKYPDAEIVGKDFPVFIAKNKDGEKCEYAFARTERKHRLGHNGFITEIENVSLKADLMRRDLTINSIAYDEENDEYFDYYGGIEDLENKILSATSIAFTERNK